VSLNYSASSDSAARTSPTGLGSAAQMSYIGWFRPNALTNSRILVRAGGSTAGSVLFRLSGTAGDFQVVQTSSGGGNLTATSSGTPLTTLNKWYCVAMSIQIGTLAKLFVGDLATLLAETSYATQTVGVAPHVTDTGTESFGLGQNAASNVVAWQGDIGPVQAYDRALSIGELRSLQWAMHIRMLANCRGSWQPGDSGTSAIPDRSGNGNTLTITGAVQSNNAPLRARARRLIRVSYSAGATNAAPTASITAPATGSSAAFGATVNFTGTGADAEDGTLTGASLAWSSNRDGALGTGTALSKSNLSVGIHTITLTATDSLGATGTSSITLTITAPASKAGTLLQLFSV
jgi:hypothetical protein